MPVIINQISDQQRNGDISNSFTKNRTSLSASRLYVVAKLEHLRNRNVMACSLDVSKCSTPVSATQTTSSYQSSILTKASPPPPPQIKKMSNTSLTLSGGVKLKQVFWRPVDKKQISLIKKFSILCAINVSLINNAIYLISKRK